MAEEILRMDHITKRFGGITALSDVQFSCNKGEVHVLAGENGAGKSTILKMLAGIHQPDEGDICFYGKKVEIRTPEQSQKLGIAMVFQELTLVGEMSVAENIYLNQEPVNRLGRINKKEIDQKLREAMDRYDIHIDPEALVNTLSVAQQQMTEILKILVRDPELIILDEPTSALAKKEVTQLYQIIGNLIRAGKTIIFISHRLEELFELGDRITVFKDGTYVGTREMKELDQDELIKMMVGRSLNNIFPPAVCEVEKDKTIFSVSGLSDAAHKLNDISFEVKRGEILGIAGLQGHGQTELLNAISGLYPLASGEIRVGGQNVHVRHSADAIAQGIALVPSDRKNQGLMLELSNRHNLSVSSLKKRMKGFLIDESREKEFAEDMKAKLSIKIGSMELPVSSLSGGNQQKVVLGKELATEPKVILFDEPTRGIDVEAKREFYVIMHKLAADGVAVIMNSSDMMEVMGMSSRVIVMYEGRITGILEKEELTEEVIMQYEMGLKSSAKKGAETA
ncbi:MAG: sugar ABC transporter ATP-binding protein [Lachnospiraceae bacterium]|nr:sugar ABC transporter ATP-binding protein [Lachnospiraceae bacterium]